MNLELVKEFLEQTSERLNRAGVILIDLKEGYPQSFIRNLTLCQAFGSPLPEFIEAECQYCARYRSRLTELQTRIDELEQGQANARPEAQSLEAQSQQFFLLRKTIFYSFDFFLCQIDVIYPKQSFDNQGFCLTHFNYNKC